jgi:hypothetical protein
VQREATVGSVQRSRLGQGVGALDHRLAATAEAVCSRGRPSVCPSSRPIALADSRVGPLNRPSPTSRRGAARRPARRATGRGSGGRAGESGRHVFVAGLVSRDAGRRCFRRADLLRGRDSPRRLLRDRVAEPRFATSKWGLTSAGYSPTVVVVLASYGVDHPQAGNRMKIASDHSYHRS